MAFSDSQGNNFTNHSAMKSSEARMQAKMPAKAPMATPDNQQGGPPPIESDPEAMQCVEVLKQKGYTADDVEQAMGQSEGEEAGAGAPPAGM